MKKMGRILSLCLVIVMVAGAMTACGIEKEELIGTWSGSYEYEGNQFTVAIVFTATQYSKVVMKNGSISSSDVGDYEISGREVKLYASDSLTYHGTWTTYKYSGGQLENNGHYLSKTQ